MIIIGEKAYLKSYDSKVNNELNTQYEIGKQINIQKEENSKSKVARKESKTSNNDIYKNMRDKASILKKDQRDIQEKVSLIQIQEQEVQNMENTLKEVKSNYIKAIKQGKQEEIREKVKIKKIESKVEDLQQKYTSENEYLEDDSKILGVLDKSLEKINDIKSKLARYKYILITLENDIDINKKEIESELNLLDNYEIKDEYINYKTITNPLDFIFIDTNQSNNNIISIIL